MILANELINGFFFSEANLVSISNLIIEKNCFNERPLLYFTSENDTNMKNVFLNNIIVQDNFQNRSSNENSIFIFSNNISYVIQIDGLYVYNNSGGILLFIVDKKYLK